jgi:hypothetical protein
MAPGQCEFFYQNSNKLYMPNSCYMWEKSEPEAVRNPPMSNDPYWKYWGAATITNWTHVWKLMNKAKFTSAGGVYVSDLSQASQHTHNGAGNCLHFIPYAALSLFSKEGAQIHHLPNWLRLRFRGGHRGRTDMIGEHGQKIWLVSSKTKRWP